MSDGWLREQRRNPCALEKAGRDEAHSHEQTPGASDSLCSFSGADLDFGRFPVAQHGLAGYRLEAGFPRTNIRSAALACDGRAVPGDCGIRIDAGDSWRDGRKRTMQPGGPASEAHHVQETEGFHDIAWQPLPDPAMTSQTWAKD